MKLSIIIPAYNTGSLLKIAVDSVLKQPYADWELIIIDDGSTDNTLSIAQEMSRRDKRIKAIHSDNQGAYKARLLGVYNSEGEFIMFMDSDDSITKECIPGLFECVKQDTDIVVGTINLNNKQIYRHQISGLISSEEYLEAVLLSHTSIGPYAKLFRKSIFKNIVVPKIRITVNEDLLLLVYLARNARNIFVESNLVCYNYIHRDNSGRTALMTLNQWQELFYLTSEIANSYNNPSVDRALTEFKLNRIRNCMILRGLFVKASEPMFSDLINKSMQGFSDSAQKTFSILKSPIKQRILYLKNETVLKIKKIAKFILRIK